MQRPSWMYTPSGHTTQKTSLWPQNNVVGRRNDVIIASRARRAKTHKCTHIKIQFDHSGTEIEIFQDENFKPMWLIVSITRSSSDTSMTMLDKPQIWVNVFLSSTRRIPTTRAICILLDKNKICFYFIKVYSVCQGLNKYGKFPCTLFHTSYASGNLMLVYMNATQSAWSGTRFSDHTLLLSIVEKSKNLLHVYPDLLLRWDEVTSSLVLPNVWLFKTCLFETHSQYYKSQKLNKKTNRPKHLLNLSWPNDTT